MVWDLRALAPLAAVGGVDHPIKSVSFGGAAAPAPPAAASTLPAASLLAYGGDGDAIGVEAWASPPPGGARRSNRGDSGGESGGKSALAVRMAAPGPG